MTGKLLNTAILVVMASLTMLPAISEVDVSTADSDYVLAPGDVLSIQSPSGNSQNIPIMPDGTAVTTYTGLVQAGGMSLGQLNELINKAAERWFVNPHMVVTLTRRHRPQVYLLGELAHPGSYSGNSDQALTLSVALSLAGGLKEAADLRHVRITRVAPKQTMLVDLWDLLTNGDNKSDMVLQPGDVVYVPKPNTSNVTGVDSTKQNGTAVRVIGSVNRPGLVYIGQEDDLMLVIAKAGGFSVKRPYVYVARANSDGTVHNEKVDIRELVRSGNYLKVAAGDIIIVKEKESINTFSRSFNPLKMPVPVGDFGPSLHF